LFADIGMDADAAEHAPNPGVLGRIVAEVSRVGREYLAVARTKSRYVESLYRFTPMERVKLLVVIWAMRVLYDDWFTVHGAKTYAAPEHKAMVVLHYALLVYANARIVREMFYQPHLANGHVALW
jgi:hypothetical protein